MGKKRICKYMIHHSSGTCFLLILHKNAYSGSKDLFSSSGQKARGIVWGQDKYIWPFPGVSPSPLLSALQAPPEMGSVSMKLAAPGVFLFRELLQSLQESHGSFHHPWLVARSSASQLQHCLQEEYLFFFEINFWKLHSMHLLPYYGIFRSCSGKISGNGMQHFVGGCKCFIKSGPKWEQVRAPPLHRKSEEHGKSRQCSKGKKVCLLCLELVWLKITLTPLLLFLSGPVCFWFHSLGKQILQGRLHLNKNFNAHVNAAAMS